jgi:hypothetical protein
MSMANLPRFVLFCLLSTLPAAAQLTSASLRAKFGAPIDGKTFHTPQGLELTATYGFRNRVCMLDVRPEREPAKRTKKGSNPMREIHNLLTDLLPTSVRGKERGALYQQAGPWLTITTDMYEHLNISEGDEVVRVQFNDCR